MTSHGDDNNNIVDDDFTSLLYNFDWVFAVVWDEATYYVTIIIIIQLLLRMMDNEKY
jgi:hypothetical protein